MHSHSTSAIRLAAQVAATSLVIASAGFGAVFAYKIGIEHSPVLACLTVLFAVALEITKPIAVTGAFHAFGRLHLGKGLCLALLALVAIAYSLTSEIALTASSRSDLAASRVLESSSSDASKTKYDQAVAELKLIHPSRTVPEIEADILRTANERAIAKLKGEKARTERREKLQGVVSAYQPGVHREADPGSRAIATYLSALGLVFTADSIAQWLNLIPVLALELGSALAGVLVNVVSASVRGPSVAEVPSEAVLVLSEPPETRPERLLPDHSIHKEAVARLILSYLQNHNGTIQGSERSIATAIGTTKPTLRRTVQSLAASGALTSISTKRGTVITLRS